MSKAGDGEDEDECFYESLDHILPSATSCSSSSAGEDDDKDPNSTWGSPNNATDLPTLPIPRFPMGVSNNYDMWTAEPLSVEERRIRLLRQMGLSRDPVLTRHRSSLSCASEDGGGISRRSVSADLSNGTKQLIEVAGSCSPSGVARSGSGGATNHDRSESSLHDYCNCNSSFSSPKILSINSVSPSVNEIGDSFVNSPSVAKSRIGNGSLGMNTGSPNKPPSGKRYSCLEEYRNDSNSLNPKADCDSSPLSSNANAWGLHGATDCNGTDNDDSAVCTIKNLDNGEEFVVNEVREDGTWNKLKEVGTGRQLTMEEFETFVGYSPIVQELMRRQGVEDGSKDNLDANENGSGGGGTKLKKRGSWLKSIRNAASSMTGLRDRRNSDEKDTSSEKCGRRSSSATDDSQDVSFHGPQRVRVRQYGKSCKELTALYKTQEIQAHTGSIWTIKFSMDGKYLASAGEDCVIHVWKVLESERKADLFMDKPEDGNLNLFFVANGSPEPTSISPKKRRVRSSITRKSVSLDCILVPQTVFALSEKPVCSFQGHVDDVLDLSWSKSQHLLSSSMDKTVRLWNLSSDSCLKIFSHSDYVTCIQFNPVDDRYFISGSLDAKVRIWSIPDRQVVDWSDLHEMVTAACYTPDGQGAMVGSYKGSCRLYDTSENKLQQRGLVNLQNKNKKSHHKKITGFQFSPGSSSEVLVTSADSRIRVIDDDSLVHKFKGFRNSNSQISGSVTGNGKFVICASEDSHVYVWKHKGDSRPSGRNKGVTVTQSYEHFHCQDVSVATPWPGMSESWGLDEVSTANHPPTPADETNYVNDSSPLSLNGTITSATNSYFFDRISATWPEEKLVLATKKHNSPRLSVDFNDGANQSSRSAWGMVIVTAGLQGKITTFQNFGLPVRF